MRKLLISLLLAGGAVTPALADPPHFNAPEARAERAQAHSERQAARQDRQQSRVERSAPQGGVARPQVSGPAGTQGPAPVAGTNVSQPRGATPMEHAASSTRGDRSHVGPYGEPDRARDLAPDRLNVPRQGFAGGGSDRGNGAGVRRESGGSDQGQNAYVAPGPKMVRPGDRTAAREVRAASRDEARQQRVDARELRQAARTPRNPPPVSEVPRQGTQPPPTDKSRSQWTHWDKNWRHDSKYDWSNYRRHHRSRFHLGFYYDPFGWGYQPYYAGWRLWPSYYSRNYWIEDPSYYRLPYAPLGFRWVRYYDDAVLVDTWTGEVVDVIYNFFW
jgi:hypothetical protein